jgi:hypothetical protein
LRALVLVLLCAGCWDWESLGGLYEPPDFAVEDAGPSHHDLRAPEETDLSQ